MKIKSFYINNFRSLVDFKIVNFDDTTIFYGENNAGKSNVLNALTTIFMRKRSEQGGPFQSFYSGIIDKFSNNFYGNKTENINFVVEVSLNKDEINLGKIVKDYIKLSAQNIFKISGNISKQTIDSAVIATESILLNKTLIYQSNDKTSYFPKIKKKIDEGQLSEVFTNLIDPLNECVTIINSDRDMFPASFNVDVTTNITPRSFKNFMHTLYLSEEKHQIFEKINSVFNREPFRFGEISFARIGSDLELMIKGNDIRLPIKHLGSGVLQSLYIIASVIYNNHKVICIEEPEQNLSPKKQNLTLRKLQSMINDTENGDLQQIIMSSHSSVFANPKLGYIYFLEKMNDKTIVKETIPTKQKLIKSKSFSQYMLPSISPFEGYTSEEMKEKFNEFQKITERLFKR